MNWAAAKNSTRTGASSRTPTAMAGGTEAMVGIVPTVRP